MKEKLKFVHKEREADREWLDGTVVCPPCPLYFKKAEMD